MKMINLKFVKMHALENDYIYIDCFENPEYLSFIPEIVARVKDLCRIKTGIGADGVIFLCPSKIVDFEMRMYNSDGSEGKMCGNGIRCCAKIAFDRGYIDKYALCNTKSGIKALEIGEKSDIIVSINKANILQKGILNYCDTIFDYAIVWVGNTHICVKSSLALTATSAELAKMAEYFKAQLKEEDANFELFYPDNTGIRMKVFENGTGETRACGTGACACVASFQTFAHDFSVYMDGGTAKVSVVDGNITLKSPCHYVFEGQLALKMNEHIQKTKQK